MPANCMLKTLPYEETATPSTKVAANASRQGRALLNLGCGAYSHPAFVNVDLIRAPGVITHDLTRGIPFPDAAYDLVYHSTMLSHFRPADALELTRECRRVLKPGGVLRVVTEDLEQMCRVYLQKLEDASRGDRQSAYDYEWMLLELYDQATRDFPGGGMLEYVRQDPLPNEAFLYARVGETGRRMVSGTRPPFRTNPGRPRGIRPLLAGIRASARRAILTALIGRDGIRALEVGRFRLSSGQVSYRMYDRYSLGQLLASAGFSSVSLTTATESAYAFWSEVNLDIASDGRPARPHTLIMAGIRT
jgi:SAM-dependent methyltransferase